MGLFNKKEIARIKALEDRISSLSNALASLKDENQFKVGDCSVHFRCDNRPRISFQMAIDLICNHVGIKLEWSPEKIEVKEVKTNQKRK